MMYILFTLLLTVVVFFVGWRPSKGNIVSVSTWSVIFFLIMGLINYFGLPVLNFWGFHEVWIQITSACLVGAILSLDDGDGWYDDFYWPKWVPFGITLIIFGFAQVDTWAMFGDNSEKYQKILGMENANIIESDSTFSYDVSPIPIEKMREVDASYAKLLAGDKLGNDPGLSSRTKIGRMTIQNITADFVINGEERLVFKNDFIWIAPLEHTGFFKWKDNKTTPGYVIVDATNYKNVYLVTSVNRDSLNLKYIETSCFSTDLERHIRNNGYMSRGIIDPCFEIDPDGRPFWVFTAYEKKVGFGGSSTVGAITVDAQTGDIAEYTVDSAPFWVDRIQPESFISKQISDWGAYKHGWKSSWRAEKDVEAPTPGMVVVSSGDRSCWYTGIKSSKAEGSTSGFMLIDTRNKEVKLYRNPGINETAAKEVAEDIAGYKAAGYKATDPVLYNLRGVPTYFMAMKGANNINAYVFVSVADRQVLGFGKTKRDAERSYIDALLKMSQDQKLVDGPVSKVEAKEYVVKDIVFEEGAYYLIFEEIPNKEFYGNSNLFLELKWTRKGHKVKMSYEDGESVQIPMNFFDNLNFSF